MRHSLLYTLVPHSSSKSLDQIRQTDQNLIAEVASAGSNHHKGIDCCSVRATGQYGLQLPFGIVKVHSLFTPVVAVFDQLKVVIKQGMKWVGYSEAFRYTARMRCS
jgi:hypothetical protein